MINKDPEAFETTKSLDDHPELVDEKATEHEHTALRRALSSRQVSMIAIGMRPSYLHETPRFLTSVQRARLELDCFWELDGHLRLAVLRVF